MRPGVVRASTVGRTAPKVHANPANSQAKGPLRIGLSGEKAREPARWHASPKDTISGKRTEGVERASAAPCALASQPLANRFPENPVSNPSDLKYTDTGGIFDIMAVTVIRHHLAWASA